MLIRVILALALAVMLFSGSGLSGFSIASFKSSISDKELETSTAIFGRIAYVDYKECAIYDRDSLVAFVIIFCYSLYQGNIKDALIGAGVGLAIGFLIFFTAYKLYGFEAFGLGDVLLLGILGLFFAQDFLSYLCISLTVSGFLVLVCIPFVGYERISRTEHRLHLYSYYGFPFLCWLVSHL